MRSRISQPAWGTPLSAPTMRTAAGIVKRLSHGLEPLPRPGIGEKDLAAVEVALRGAHQRVVPAGRRLHRAPAARHQTESGLEQPDPRQRGVLRVAENSRD